jgi:hypothetical protein
MKNHKDAYFLDFSDSLIDEKKEDIKISTKGGIEELANKKFSGSYLEVLALLQNLANQNDITILTDEKDKEAILLKGKADKTSLQTFIKQIENINNFSKISSLVLNKNDIENNYTFDLKIDFSKFYFKQLQKLEDIKIQTKIEEKTTETPLITQAKEKEFVENNKFTINAIVDKYALINGNWILENEEIDGYKLVELQMYFVILKNENEKIKLEVDHGEYFKNIN